MDLLFSFILGFLIGGGVTYAVTVTWNFRKSGYKIHQVGNTAGRDIIGVKKDNVKE